MLQQLCIEILLLIYFNSSSGALFLLFLLTDPDNWRFFSGRLYNIRKMKTIKNKKLIINIQKFYNYSALLTYDE